MKKIIEPDITNEDKEYWEKILESWGLGERQLGLKKTEPEEEPSGDRLENNS